MASFWASKGVKIGTMVGLSIVKYAIKNHILFRKLYFNIFFFGQFILNFCSKFSFSHWLTIIRGLSIARSLQNFTFWVSSVKTGDSTCLTIFAEQKAAVIYLSRKMKLRLLLQECLRQT